MIGLFQELNEIMDVKCLAYSKCSINIRHCCLWHRRNLTNWKLLAKGFSGHRDLDTANLDSLEIKNVTRTGT